MSGFVYILCNEDTVVNLLGHQTCVGFGALTC